MGKDDSYHRVCGGGKGPFPTPRPLPTTTTYNIVWEDGVADSDSVKITVRDGDRKAPSPHAKKNPPPTTYHLPKYHLEKNPLLPFLFRARPLTTLLS